MSQAKRYMTLAALTKRDQLDSAYHAAFYLLSADPELYEVASRYVSVEGIHFAGIKRATRGFDERTRFVVDIAHNLFSYNSPCKATPFEISRLGYPLMEQVCNALYIAADGYKVVIEQDQNQELRMTLDASPYERMKLIQIRFEQMTAALMAQPEAAADDEMER